MKTRGSILLLLSSVLMMTAGCSGGGRAAASIPSAPVSAPSGSASASLAAPPSAAQASSGVDLPANPPAASADPSVDPGSMGKVTAVRLADPLVGWAGGDGWIARTNDGGKRWSVQLRHQYVVLQIFALNAKKAWAALDIGDKRGVKLIRTTNGGTHWTDAGVVPNYSFFHFISDNVVLSGNALSTDGAKTWRKLPIPKGTVGDAYFHDPKNGWAVTSPAGKFLIQRTTDGGKTWRTSLSRKSEVPVLRTVIRSAGNNDAWVELVGGSGMTQTSYSLFHTADGRKWQPVVANTGNAGSGAAPGFGMVEKKVPRNGGSSPGTLYVASPTVAFMGGQCLACDNPNTIGKTTDGGKTWVNLKPKYAGYETQQIAVAHAKHVWWINGEPSRMYVTSDGGAHWTRVHTFAKPKS